MTAWQIVDQYLGQLKVTTFYAWQLNDWLQANHPAWANQASQMLMQHKDVQAQRRTKHLCYSTRRGPYAPWKTAHKGAWKRAALIKTQQLCHRDLWVNHACRSLPLARWEDALNGHVKTKASDPDGPVLTDCKTMLRNQGYGLNAMLVAMGLAPVDVEAILARY